MEQCGNGARCFVRFVHEQGLTGKSEIKVETRNGVIGPGRSQRRSHGRHGEPRFSPADIPSSATPTPLSSPCRGRGGRRYQRRFHGQPHAVQVVADVDSAPVAVQGPLIENHPPDFPQRVNVGFRRFRSSTAAARLRVFERGSGKPWPAAPAPAPRPSPASAAAFSLRRCASAPAAATSTSPGTVGAAGPHDRPGHHRLLRKNRTMNPVL